MDFQICHRTTKGLKCDKPIIVEVHYSCEQCSFEYERLEYAPQMIVDEEAGTVSLCVYKINKCPFCQSPLTWNYYELRGRHKDDWPQWKLDKLHNYQATDNKRTDDRLMYGIEEDVFYHE